MDGGRPPQIAGVVFWGVEFVYTPQSAPLFQQWCITTTLECFEGHAHPQQPQKLGGLLPIHLTRWSREKGLMWDTRGRELYLLVAAMVGYNCVGWWWQLEANLRSTYYRNSKNCLRKYFFHSYVDPISPYPLGTFDRIVKKNMPEKLFCFWSSASSSVLYICICTRGHCNILLIEDLVQLRAQKHKPTMVSAASPRAANPKMVESPASMAHASSS